MRTSREIEEVVVEEQAPASMEEVVIEPSPEPIVESKPKIVTPGRVSLSILFSGITLCIIFFTVYSVYLDRVVYPDREEIPDESTGMYAIESWLSEVRELGAGEYISKEVEFANGNENKLDFYRKVLATVSYTPDEVQVRNIYGNTYIDRKTNKPVVEVSGVVVGEEVTLGYVDYAAIEPDKDAVKDLMLENSLKIGDADYNNKLVDVFCQYMNSLEELPLVEIAHIPSLSATNTGYEVTQEEDIFLDQLLFSSQEFKDLVYRFSEVAGKVTSGKKSKNFKPTKEWTEWNKLPKKKKAKREEPEKYTYKQLCDSNWCGVYDLLKNGVKEVPDLGVGTLEDPAGIGTSILTNWLVDGKNGLEKMPIKVKMVEYGVSEDAIDWFESKDERNRGIDVTSEIQYCYYVFEITNLSGETLVIKDDSSLCDSGANLAPRTGTIYGLQDKVTIKPDEIGIIETWGKSTELNKKYVVWGKSFERREQPVWFRVLAGNLEDLSEDKGVRVNDSRDSKEGEEQDAPIEETPEMPTSEL